jgi:hypothetical protein
MANKPNEAQAIDAIGGPKRTAQAAPGHHHEQMKRLQEAQEANKQPETQEARDKKQPAEGQEAQHQAQLAPEEGVDLSDKAQAELEAQKEQEAKEAEEAKQKELEEKQKEYEEKVKELENKVQDLNKQIEKLLAEGKQDEARPLIDQVAGLEKEMEQLKQTHAGSPEAQQGWAPQPGATIGGTNTGQGGMQPWVPMNLGGQGQWNATPANAYDNVKAANPNVEIPDLGKTGNKKEIGQMLNAASDKYGIPPNILKAVAWQESGWNPNAKSFDGQHGKGVMQIDDRFHEFARGPEAFDPKKNIDYGAKYLSSLKQKYGSWEEALHHYNGGSTYAGKVMALAEKQPWAQYA